MAFNLGFPAYSAPVINPEHGQEPDVSPASHRTDDVDLHHPVGSARVRWWRWWSIRFGSRTHASIVGSLMIVAGASAMATVVDHGARCIPRLRADGRWRCVHRRGDCRSRPRCLAGSCAAARWRCRSCTPRARSAAAFAAKSADPGPLRAGGWRRRGWWVIASFSALAAVLALLFVRERPEDMGLS